ncbi:MAG: hypothetical protein ABIE07_00745 [Candidatus Zixiibacteriota bacterium]
MMKLDLRMVICLGLMAIITLGGCKTQEVEGIWAENTVQIDGNNNDWPDKASIFFSEQNAALSISNDNDFLYILFRTTDAQWAKIIKMTGLKLSLNSKGNKDISILYKGGPTEDELRATSGQAGVRMGQIPMQMRDRMGTSGQMESFTLNIEDENFEKMISPNGNNGPAVAFDTCQGFYTYEFRIPLEVGSENYFGIGVKPGDKIGIGAEWGDMGDMKRTLPSEAGVGRGGSGGGRGGRGGGKSGGRGGGGGSDMRLEMPQKQEVRIKTQLSLSPEDKILDK